MMDTMHSFRDVFSRTPMVVADAPGRVNLIGEHTETHGGYVLPLAVPQRATVELAVRSDDIVRLCSTNVEGADRVTYVLRNEHRAKAWFDYVQGLTRALRAAGHAFRGFDARIDSNVPVRCGLSSSAALGVAMLRALREAFQLELDDVALALVAQRSANDIAGAPNDVMSPLASSLADERTAVFIDTRSLRTERVSLPHDIEIALVDSGVMAPDAEAAMMRREKECALAAKLLGVEELRDAYALDRIDELPEPLRKRARHVISENARVLAAVEAMRADDAVALGGLFLESHVSMRDDFEVSVPEVDELVMRAVRDPAVYGARLTGCGFGGSIVVLAHAGEAAAAAQRIADGVDGARVVTPFVA